MSKLEKTQWFGLVRKNRFLSNFIYDMTIVMFETCYLVHGLLGADIMELVQLRLCGQDEDHSGEDDNKQREEGVDLQQTIIIYSHDHC